jgi:putative hydrolase of the HAD superfamily
MVVMKAKKEGKIKAVIFDIGGVLQESKSSYLIGRNRSAKGVHEYVAKKLGISIDQYFDSIDTIYAESIVGSQPKNKVLKIFAKNLKTSQSKLKKLYTIAYKKNFKENKKLYSFAFKLKKQGYKIAILSDQWYISEEIFAPNKVMNKFNAVVISSRVGIRKPDPKIYKLTLKKLKLPAKQTVFIDNQVWNTKPAKKLGMKTVLFKNNKQTFKDLKKLGVE